jgi:hypothetical protein
MAKIRRLNRTLVTALLDPCPQCSAHLHEFLTVLRDSRSLKDESWAALGYECVREATEMRSDARYRRHYQFKLRDCGGVIGFYWKKAVVDGLRFNC